MRVRDPIASGGGDGAPEVTAVIPAHNRAEALMRAVRSVLDQRGVPVTCVVVDDGSTIDLSGVRALLEQTAGEHVFVCQSQQGVAAARNRGVCVATTPWIAFLDSDDYWEPDKLAIQLDYHRHHPEYLVSQTAESWWRGGRPVPQPNIYRPGAGDLFGACLRRCCLSASSVMMARDFYLAQGGFDERYPVCEDYELWLRLAVAQEIGWIEKPLTVKHAGHPDQLSKAIPAMDRFRLHALLELWRNHETRRSLIAAEIHRKAALLAKGARKRGLADSLYRDCQRWTDLTEARALTELESLRRRVEGHMHEPLTS